MGVNTFGSPIVVMNKEFKNIDELNSYNCRFDTNSPFERRILFDKKVFLDFKDNLKEFFNFCEKEFSKYPIKFYEDYGLIAGALESSGLAWWTIHKGLSINKINEELSVLDNLYYGISIIGGLEGNSLVTRVSGPGEDIYRREMEHPKKEINLVPKNKDEFHKNIEQTIKEIHSLEKQKITEEIFSEYLLDDSPFDLETIKQDVIKNKGSIKYNGKSLEESFEKLKSDKTIIPCKLLDKYLSTLLY